MTEISRTVEIEVRAPAQGAFDTVVADILVIKDDPEQFTGHRPIDDGPLRVGFRWQQTIVHDRATCRKDWIVTELHEPWVLEQALEHLCMAKRREVLGGERWQFEEAGDGRTRVALRAWRQSTWLERLFASHDDAIDHSLRKRLAYVQFRAERGSPRPA